MTAAAAVPLIVSLGGAAAQYIASERASARRNNQLSALSRDQEQFGQKNRALTTDLAKQYDPNARAEVLKGLAGAKEASLTADTAKADLALPETGYSGRSSKAYDTTKAAVGAKEAQRQVDLTKLLSKVMAPKDLRTQEGFATSDVASQNSTDLTNLHGLATARQNDIQSIAPDPLLMFAGSAAQGVGSGLAAGNYQKRLDAIYAGLFGPGKGKAGVNPGADVTN